MAGGLAHVPCSPDKSLRLGVFTAGTVGSWGGLLSLRAGGDPGYLATLLPWAPPRLHLMCGGWPGAGFCRRVVQCPLSWGTFWHGCPAAPSLYSTGATSVPPKCIQTWPDVPWGKITPMRTAGQDLALQSCCLGSPHRAVLRSPLVFWPWLFLESHLGPPLSLPRASAPQPEGPQPHR